jgi:hypothetical protein
MPQQQQDDAQTILSPLSVPDNVKADAWDAYHQSQDEPTFTKRMKALNIPEDAKATLWDKRWGLAPAKYQAQKPPAPYQLGTMDTLRYDWNKIKTTTGQALGKVGKAWEAARQVRPMSPYGQLPFTVGQAVDFANKPLTSSEDLLNPKYKITPEQMAFSGIYAAAQKVRDNPEAANWVRNTASTIAGLQESGADVVSSLSSPFNLALLAGGVAAKVPKLVSALASAGFTAQMVDGAVEAIGAGNKAYDEFKRTGDRKYLQEAVRYYGGGTVTGVLSALSAHHTVVEGLEAIDKSGKPKVTIDTYPKTGMTPAPQPPAKTFTAPTDIVDVRGTNMASQLIPAEQRGSQYLAGSEHPELSGKITEPGERRLTEEDAAKTLAGMQRLKFGTSQQNRIEVENNVGEKERVSPEFAKLPANERREFDTKFKELQSSLPKESVTKALAETAPRAGYYEGRKETAMPGKVPPPLGWRQEAMKAPNANAAVDAFRKNFPDASPEQQQHFRNQWTKANPIRNLDWLFTEATVEQARDYYKNRFPGASDADMTKLLAMWDAAKRGDIASTLKVQFNKRTEMQEAADAFVADYGGADSKLDKKGDNSYSPFAVVRLNKQAHGLFSFLITQDRDWSGLSFDAADSSQVATYLDAFAKRAPQHGMEQIGAAAHKIAEQIRQSVGDNGSAGALIVNESESPIFVANTILHESFHGGQRILGGMAGQMADHIDVPMVANHPVTMKIQTAMAGLGYSPQQVVDPAYVASEGAAHILEGAGERDLGLSLQQQIDWLLNYRDALISKHGESIFDKPPEGAEGYLDAIKEFIGPNKWPRKGAGLRENQAQLRENAGGFQAAQRERAGRGSEKTSRISAEVEPQIARTTLVSDPDFRPTPPELKRKFGDYSTEESLKAAREARLKAALPHPLPEPKTLSLQEALARQEWKISNAELGKGRWLFKRGEGDAIEFYSPNVYGPMNFEEARERLKSDDQKILYEFATDVDRHLEVKATHENAIGDWVGGAENSVVTTIKGTDWDTVRYSAALKGRFASQNVVIPFLADPAGPDFLIDFELNHGKVYSKGEYQMQDVRDVLDGAGIQHRTLIPRGDKIAVMIFQGGGKVSDLPTLAKRLGDRFGLKQQDLNLTRGRGEFLGNESDQKAAAGAYAAAIREFESKYPDRAYRGPVYGRDASEAGVGIYPARPGENPITDARENARRQGRRDLGKLYNFLDHGEKEFSSAEKKKISETIQKIPAVQQFVAAAKAGAIGRYWYERASKVFDALQQAAPDMFRPEDRDRFTKVVAALSPQTPVDRDLAESLYQWKRWTDAGRPMDRPRLNKLFKNVMQGWQHNLIRAILGERLQGQKVTQFAKALQGIHGPVVNDTWMALFSGIDGRELENRAVYEAVAARVRQAADKLGWHPEEVQASIWTFIKTLAELSGRNGMRPPGEVLKIMSSEDMQRRGTDMAGIMLHEDIQNRLEQLGVPVDELRRRIEQLELPQADAGGIEAVDRDLLGFAARRLETARPDQWDKIARKSEDIGQGTFFTREKYEAGKHTLANLLLSESGEMQAKFNTDGLRALVDVGGYLFETGIRNFAAWSKELVDQFGEGVRPYLKQAWKEVGGSAKELKEAEKAVKTAPTVGSGKPFTPKPKTPAALPPVPADLRPAQVGEGIIRSFTGHKSREAAIMVERLFKDKERLEKLSKEDALRWMYKMEEPKTQGDHVAAEDRNLAKLMRETLDKDRDDLVRIGKLKEWIEDYWPHQWENSSNMKETIARLMGKRPLAGRGGFLKSRSIPTMREGVEVFGKTPISYNPVDNFLIRHLEIRRYVLAYDAFDDFKRTGLAVQDDGKTEIPEGWQKYNDSIAGGKWYGPPDAARVFNNFVEPGWLSGSTGAPNKVVDLVRRFNNSTALLSVSASLFHVSMTSGVSVMSEAALATKNIGEGTIKTLTGRPSQGIPQIGRGLKSLARAGVAVPLDLRLGRRLRGEYVKPGTHPELADVLERAVDSGFRMATRQETMDFLYNNDAMRAFKTALKDKRYGTAVLRAMPAMLEKIARPVMVHWVPLLKSAADFRGIQEELALGAGDKSIYDQREKLGRVVDEMDNRYGQMIADNLFWNKKFRDATLLAFRYVDYNFGNTRMLLGDIPKAITHRSLEPTILGDFKKLATKGEITHRLAFTMVALPFVTALMNGLLQTLVYRQPEPLDKELGHLLKGAKTGRKNPDGTDELVSMIGYMKTMMGLAQPVKSILTGHPLEAMPELKDLAKSHLSGSVQFLWETANNENFWRHEKLHDDNLPGLKGEAKELMQFFGRVAESMGPMSLRNIMEMPAQPGEPAPQAAARRFGILQKPPVSLQRNDWQQAIVVAASGHLPQAPMEPGAYNEYQTRLKWEEEIMAGTKTQSDMQRAVRKGELSQKDATAIMKMRQPGADYFMERYKGLGLNDALRIYDMVPEEDTKTRSKMRQILRTKEHLLYNIQNNEKRQELKQRLHEALRPEHMTPPPQTPNTQTMYQ